MHLRRLQEDKDPLVHEGFRWARLLDQDTRDWPRVQTAEGEDLAPPRGDGSVSRSPRRLPSSSGNAWFRACGC